MNSAVLKQLFAFMQKRILPCFPRPENTADAFWRPHRPGITFWLCAQQRNKKFKYRGLRLCQRLWLAGDYPENRGQQIF